MRCIIPTTQTSDKNNGTGSKAGTSDNQATSEVTAALNLVDTLISKLPEIMQAYAAAQTVQNKCEIQLVNEKLCYLINQFGLNSEAGLQIAVEQLFPYTNATVMSYAAEVALEEE